jgi:hypothetical protein
MGKHGSEELLARIPAATHIDLKVRVGTGNIPIIRLIKDAFGWDSRLGFSMFGMELYKKRLVYVVRS